MLNHQPAWQQWLQFFFSFCYVSYAQEGETGKEQLQTGLSKGMASASDEAKRESLAALGKEDEERNKLVFINEEKLFNFGGSLEGICRGSGEGLGTLRTSYKAVLEDGLIVAVGSGYRTSMTPVRMGIGTALMP